MKGTNTLRLNQATVAQAVQDYLNAQLLSTRLVVQSVMQPGDDDFVVIVKTDEPETSL